MNVKTGNFRFLIASELQKQRSVTSVHVPKEVRIRLSKTAYNLQTHSVLVLFQPIYYLLSNSMVVMQVQECCLRESACAY